MSILAINRDILGQFLYLGYVSTLSLPPKFVFPSSFHKIFSFSRIHSNLFLYNCDPRLVKCWIVLKF